MAAAADRCRRRSDLRPSTATSCPSIQGQLGEARAKGAHTENHPDVIALLQSARRGAGRRAQRAAEREAAGRTTRSISR